MGVYTNDVGVSRAGTLKGSFEPGMAFRSKVTLLAEGAHGSLSKVVLDKYGLRKESEGQTYGFGVKEVWRVAPGGNRIANLCMVNVLTDEISYFCVQTVTTAMGGIVPARSFIPWGSHSMHTPMEAAGRITWMVDLSV